ncbi:hypothetical protein MLD38_006459 [Melastoma candidum]|uniref:Uncharacterized protein n=1 Tax=Melastoma candidum TaxID=119954 RepID=A0ACB9RN09_9MYRT|nr:hypothetical protein MLD38_006459 [Melastoma candidum]
MKKKKKRKPEASPSLVLLPLVLLQPSLSFSPSFPSVSLPSSSSISTREGIQAVSPNSQERKRKPLFFPPPSPHQTKFTPGRVKGVCISSESWATLGP